MSPLYQTFCMVGDLFFAQSKRHHDAPYTYGDWHRLVNKTDKNWPYLISGNTDDLDSLQISFAGMNKTLEIFIDPVTLQIGGKNIQRGIGHLDSYETNRWGESVLVRYSFRCLLEKGNAEALEFLFLTPKGWTLGCYDSDRQAFKVPVSTGLRLYPLDGALELDEQKRVHEKESVTRFNYPSSPGMMCAALSLLALAIIMGAGGATAVGLKLGSVVAESYFFYIGGGLVGGAFIALALMGVALWRRKATAHRLLG